MSANELIGVLAIVAIFFLAALVFVVRRLAIAPVWTEARRRIFGWLADFFKSLSATLVGVATIGYMLTEVDGRAFEFGADGSKLLGGAAMFMIAGLILAGSAAAKDVLDD